jgi:hypothetical protein|mmetsp:Transcript_92161/g.154596  ORF Transcript_92161/g.154596 Transcript_92161/m.154596 type:complete len:88 (-) Transcript_92161:935-1198(-)
MWDSWPFVTFGGNTPTSMALDYRKAVQALVMFQLQELGPEQMEDIMWRTAYHLFQFSECTDSCQGEAPVTNCSFRHVQPMICSICNM